MPSAGRSRVCWWSRTCIGRIASRSPTSPVWLPLHRECPCLLLMTTRMEGDPIDREWRAEAEGAAADDHRSGTAAAGRGTHARRVDPASRRGACRALRRARRRQPAVPRAARPARPGDRSTAAVPGTVQSLVQARLDRLDAADKAALQAAAVLGQRFDARRARSCARPFGLPARPARPAPSAAPATMVRASASPTRWCRDAVYDSLLKPRRRELHRQAADWFDGPRPRAARRASGPGGSAGGGGRLSRGGAGAARRLPFRARQGAACARPGGGPRASGPFRADVPAGRDAPRSRGDRGRSALLCHGAGRWRPTMRDAAKPGWGSRRASG